MDTNEISWVAGILEGEGYFQFDKNKRLAIKCSMTDEDVVKRLFEITRMGHLTNANPRGTQKKHTYTWTVCLRRHIFELLTILKPLMGERRKRRINEMLEYINANQSSFRQEKGRLAHGTRTKYNREKCRCEECCLAQHNYGVSRGVIKNFRKQVQHGSLTMYSKYRCRCDICKKASKEYEHERWLKRKEKNVTKN